MDADILNLFPIIRGELERRLDAVGERRSFPEGTVFYEEGFPCPVVPFVVSGTVRVFKIGETGREITLYRVEGGQVCVLSTSCALAGNESRLPAVAVAETAVDMLVVPAHVFRQLLHEFPEMQSLVNRTLADRLSEMMMVVDEVAFGRVDLRLAERLLRAVKDDPHAVVATTHQALAVELGSAREVVSRILKDFERKGLVRLGRGRIEVVSPKGLMAMTAQRAAS